jgi:hypothetical protein
MRQFHAVYARHIRESDASVAGTSSARSAQEGMLLWTPLLWRSKAIIILQLRYNDILYTVFYVNVKNR